MSIELRALVKNYPDFRIELDLAVGSDETLVLAGPSGCGKTTALQMIAGFVPPDAGDILVDGNSITALPAWKRGIGIVFQDLALFPHLTVGGNVAYGPAVAGVHRAERRAIVAESLAAVRLGGFDTRRIETLSGGERQRVAIARALAARPKALLMDEPFSSLDAPLRKSLRAEFSGIRRKGAFPCVFVTHDREEAAAVGDRVAVMENGAIVECGTARELFSAPRTAFAARFFGVGAVLPRWELARMGVRARGIAETLEEGSSVLVPAEALALTPRLCAESDIAASAEEVVFEGSGTRVVLAIAGAQAALTAKLERETPPPAPGERVGVRIDWARVRTVRGE